MKAKTLKSPSLIQVLIDKYIFYVLLNKSHKEHVVKNLGYDKYDVYKLKLA